MFEKKRGKRFLASVMALVMLLSLAPVGALAADDETLTTEECSAMPLPAAEDDNQQAVADEDNNTPTPQPAVDPKPVVADPVGSSSEAVILPEGDPLDQDFSVNPDTSNSNDIAEHKGGNKGDGEPVTTDSATEYVIRFYVSNTGTKEYYTEYNKYGIDGQPNSTIVGAEGGNTVTIMVSPDYAILTQYNDVAKGISTEEFKAVNVTGDTDVRAWLNQYAENEVPDGLTSRDNVNVIVDYVNTQYNNSGKNLPTLDAKNFNGFRFVDAHYVNSGECSIHVHVQLIKDNQHIVHYDPNGGEGAMVDENLYFAGNQATVKANEFTRAGYTFARWNTKADGTGTNYALDEKVTMGNENVTLYAQWTANTHTVTYTDGEDEAVFSNVAKTGTYGKAIPKYNDENTSPTRDGYAFKGWTSSVSGITPADVMPDQDVTFTAIWEKEQTTEPENPTSEINAMYFVLMPGQGVPNSGVSRGVDKYFPNASNNGGVTGKSNTTGYEGKITKAATELTGANTSNGCFDVNGVGDQYLKDIGDLGYFNAKNYNADGTYKGTLPDGLKNFNMTHKEIVWYVIKKEGNGYHVDGYVKGVPITLTYHENFGTSNAQTVINKNISGTTLNSGDKVTIQSYQQVFTGEANKHEGWTFVGWFTANGQKYTPGETTLIDSVDLYAKWTNTYTVVTHFMGADGNEKASRETSKLNGVHGTPLKDMVLSLDKVERNDISGNYVYVPSETSYSVGKVDKGKVGDATYTEANTVIHQYYYLDETGNLGEDEKGNPTDKKDGIPDAWQHKVTFKVVNGKWNDDSSDNIVVYVNAKDKDGKTLESKLTEAQIPAVGEKPNSGYRASGSWDKSLSVGLEIKGDTEFTFTYSRRSSGGSSRPSTPPTVDIPDDVPTGLNGKDHYAYIIGYGNNDVRPQNNITRAEVATIFFRLLTDETRTANMTKSNGYNDVKDGDWFCCAVSTLSKMGIIKGYEDGSFKPDQKITRAETMTLVNRVLNRLPETKDDLHKDMKTWVDNMDETAWYYLAVQEATNSHYFKNKTGTKFEQWTDLRDTRDWSELEK